MWMCLWPVTSKQGVSQRSCLMVQLIRALPQLTSAKTSWLQFLPGTRTLFFLSHTEHHCVTDSKAPTKSHFNADDCRLITLLSAGWWNSNLRCQKSIWVSIDWSAVHLTSASYSSLHTSISGTQTQPTLGYGQNLFQEAPIYYIICKFWVQSTERTEIHRIIHVCVFVCSFAFVLFLPFQIRHHIIANHCQHFSSGVSRPVLFKLSYNLTLHNNGCCF